MSERSAPRTQEDLAGDVHELSAPEVLGLRTAVLRPHFSLGQLAHFAGDALAGTSHFGVVGDGGEVLAVVSFYEQAMEGRAQESALQLRGMAVRPDFQGTGLGARLLDAALPRLALRHPGMGIVWCNARESAVGFYKRQGFVVEGEPFELPEIGPHYRMWRRMPPLVVGSAD